MKELEGCKSIERKGACAILKVRPISLQHGTTRIIQLFSTGLIVMHTVLQTVHINDHAITCLALNHFGGRIVGRYILYRDVA